MGASLAFKKVVTMNKKHELLYAMVKLSLTPLDKREEVKTMTLEEIEQELGYKVKIKGEK